LKASSPLKIYHLLTAKDFVDSEFLPGFLCVALCGSSFGSSWLRRIFYWENKSFIAFFVMMFFITSNWSAHYRQLDI
jgi:hypothetical protein